MRNTEQRGAVMAEIMKRKDHPTAYEVYHAVKQVLPNISLGTVYRNLDFLSREGMIRTLDTGAGQKRFDPNTQDHPHFRCTSCGKVEDVPVECISDYQEKGCGWLKSRLIFSIHLEFHGLCPECSGKG